MSNTPTYLVPVDLSECTANVVERAAQLARVNGARVVLLYVVQIPRGLTPDTALQLEGMDREESVATLLADEARPELDGHLEALGAQGVEAIRRLEVGDPAETILAVADELSPDLIVMGTHGRTGISRWFMGSVAESVSRRATCPVVTVRSQHQPECEASSCASCQQHVSAGARAVTAEVDG